VFKVDRSGLGSLAESGQKTLKVGIRGQGRWQKNFQRGRAQRKKRPKNSTKPLPGGEGVTEKD